VTTAATVAVVVTAPAVVEAAARQGAGGLLVPGAGPTVSREQALASLVRGRVRNSILGGTVGGRPRLSVSSAPSEITIYVSLPPPGRHHNVRRYPIAIVGGSYRGQLVSTATRIPGLVGIADVAPTVEALERGTRPVIGSRPAAPNLAKLDRRLAAAHDARPAANAVVIALVLVAAAVALARRASLAGRAALLAGPAAVTAAVALSAAGTTSRLALAIGIAVATPLLAFAAAARVPFVALLGGFLAAYALVLVSWPEVCALAALGPHPDGGVRFYGVTNQIETLLLAPVLAAFVLAARTWKVPLALLALLTLGASRIGADGGGVIVFATAFIVVALRGATTRVTLRQIGAATAGAVVLALLVAGVDIAAGGTSHVTRAVRGGPGELLDAFAGRLHISFATATDSWPNAVVVAGSIGALLLLARRRSALLDGYLVALAVSLLVNDSPVEIALYGALGALALVAFVSTREPSPSLTVPPSSAASRSSGCR
jgi:hypothetical protein